MSDFVMGEFLNKISESPVISVLIGAIIISFTILGTHLATNEDIKRLATKNDLQQIESSVERMSEKTNDIEKEVNQLQDRVPYIENRITKVEKGYKKEVEKAESDRKELRENYHQIQKELENLDGKQELTNAKLEHLKDLVKKQYEND